MTELVDVADSKPAAHPVRDGSTPSSGTTLGCSKKVRYKTEDAAQSALDSRMRFMQRGAKFSFYPCGQCKGFHLTKPRLFGRTRK